MTRGPPPTTGLLDALNARHGRICFVGAGGKKSLMFHLADTHPGRVALTATAHIERVPQRFRAAFVVAEGEALQQQVREMRAPRVVAFAKPCELPGRFGGVSDEELERLYRDGGFEACFIKADGARGRLIKAPAAHEPALSRHARVIVPVVSAAVIGQILSEKIAHRPERLAAIVGMDVAVRLTPLHIARLLSSAGGALKDVANKEVIPVINMIDDAEREAVAREAAGLALKLTDRFDRIVLTAMCSAQPLVAVITR